MVFGATIFVSAFLLFLVQLIIGKRILPWFGGAPAVWTTCMLFFQLLLLSGYAYAHFLASRFRNPVQIRIHGAFLLLSGMVLGILWWQWGTPILPGANWKPNSPEQPVWQILKLLSVSVGLPFFILSSTSPLLQRWYSLAGKKESPYRLYALSNCGSMLALLGYPFLIEPLTGLPDQGKGWGVLYFVFVLGCLACASNILEHTATPAAAAESGEVTYRRPGWISILIWLSLAASTSAMLLAVTNSLCQEVAVVPLLWVLPLTLYLLSFIICFDSPRWYRRRFFLVATAASSIVVLVTALRGIQLGIVPHIASYGLFLFFFCITCHGELVRLKPGTEYLTLFYLMVALGGAVGGIFVGLLAPAIFKGYWEFFLVLLVGWILLAIVLARDKNSPFFRGDKLHLYLIVLVAGYLAFQFTLLFLRPKLPAFLSQIPGALIGAFVLLIAFAGATRKAQFIHSKYWPRIMVGLVIFIAECFLLHKVGKQDPATATVDRNFYGVTTVARRFIPGEIPVPVLQLTHGQINHGIQYLEGDWHNKPIGYYAAGSGVGLAFKHHPRRSADGNHPQPMKVGLLGLGVGTLASYAAPQDHFRFYEINPAVVSYSLGPKPLFTYLQNSAGVVDVVLGDARLSLERELDNPNEFDILVMDVFSSDSVPVHLLTVEAFEIYLRHLRDDDSVIAVHISNRFLELQDLIANAAQRFDLSMALIEGVAQSPEKTASRWCLLTRNTSFVEIPEIKQLNKTSVPAQNLVWTDDYSNLFRLIR